MSAAIPLMRNLYFSIGGAMVSRFRTGDPLSPLFPEAKHKKSLGNGVRIYCIYIALNKYNCMNTSSWQTKVRTQLKFYSKLQ